MKTLIFALCLLLSVPAAADDMLKLHVRPSGSDAAACTAATPCKTLQGAQARIPEGVKAFVLIEGKPLLCNRLRCGPGLK